MRQAEPDRYVFGAIRHDQTHDVAPAESPDAGPAGITSRSRQQAGIGELSLLVDQRWGVPPPPRRRLPSTTETRVLFKLCSTACFDWNALIQCARASRESPTVMAVLTQGRYEGKKPPEGDSRWISQPVIPAPLYIKKRVQRLTYEKAKADSSTLCVAPKLTGGAVIQCRLRQLS
jgi:hypothetical protein